MPLNDSTESKPEVAPQYSHSFAEPLPYEPIEFESRTSKPLRPVAAKTAAPPSALQSLRSPMIGLGFGLGIAIGVIVPFLYFRNLPSTQGTATPASVQAVEEAPAAKSKIISSEPPSSPLLGELTPGPKEVPVPGARVGSSRSAARRNANSSPKATAPVVQVWGAVPDVKAVNTPSPAVSPLLPRSSAPKLEEPPSIPQPKAESVVPPLPQGAVLPSTQANAPAPERKGFFRRLARGVKSLNPIRREGLGEVSTSPAVQTSGSGNRP
jgi:hypothetical protein